MQRRFKTIIFVAAVLVSSCLLGILYSCVCCWIIICARRERGVCNGGTILGANVAAITLIRAIFFTWRLFHKILQSVDSILPFFSRSYFGYRISRRLCYNKQLVLGGTILLLLAFWNVLWFGVWFLFVVVSTTATTAVVATSKMVNVILTRLLLLLLGACSMLFMCRANSPTYWDISSTITNSKNIRCLYL